MRSRLVAESTGRHTRSLSWPAPDRPKPYARIELGTGTRRSTGDVKAGRGALVDGGAREGENVGPQPSGGITCEFWFKCPRVWDRLQPTAVQEVRHCPECERDVYLALTEEDLMRHRDKGRCVAVPMVLTAGETDDGPPMAVGMLKARYGDADH